VVLLYVAESLECLAIIFENAWYYVAEVLRLSLSII